MIDIQKVRNQFPVLKQKVYDKPLVYLDNAASSQKPQVVVEALRDYYYGYHSNVHRGVHYMSQKATDAFEQTRKAVQKFIGAEFEHEVIYTKGTTESINLVAQSMTSLVSLEDEIVISALEHHSNIVPWQELCKRTGATLKIIPQNQKGELVLDELDKIISSKTKLVAVNHISNALGTVNPIEKIITKAHEKGAWVLIDGAQSVSHLTIDVRALDADFYVFSGHKMYGPTGIGILYGKEEILKKLPPYQFGGEMIAEVTLEKTTYAGLPFKFEAGTPNIADTIALKEAVHFMEYLGIENIQKYEESLVDYALEEMNKLGSIDFVGTSKNRSGAISFNLKGQHSFDVGSILDRMGIAVRTGHHCTQPIMQFYNIPGTVRASFGVYNTEEEIDTLIQGLKKAEKMLG